MQLVKQGVLIALLRRTLDVVWYLLWAVLAVVAAAMALAIVLFLARFLGIAPEALEEALQRLQFYRVLILPLFIAEIVTIMVLVDRLRRMFATLAAGDPFVPENAGHLRVIALAVAVYQLVRYLAQGIVALSLTLFGRPVADAAEIGVSFDLNLGAWFAVVALLVLAEVFREGARMRQEQQLTI
ncbi:MAG: DUF2975 domain-containing protein [Maricaulaceae bacterium]|nr:DUF2975 domain-containing protein [Maricaulaceae bacterium]